MTPGSPGTPSPSTPSGGSDQPGDIDEDLGDKRAPNGEYNSDGACELRYGWKACQYWNRVFDPWLNISDYEKSVLLYNSEAVGGMEFIYQEAQECFEFPGPGQCNNQIWSMEDGISTIDGDYFEGVTSVMATSTNRLMFWLLEEVGADTDLHENYDPIWLHALSTNQEIFQRAKDNAFIELNNRGFMNGTGPDVFDWILHAENEGGLGE